MISCVYCHTLKGRRECPALGGLICSSCCGQHRGVDLDCPPHCRYFRTHEEYQRSRLGPEYHHAWLKATDPLYRAQQMRLLDFIVALELVIYQHLSRQTRGTDSGLLEALEYVKRKLGLIAVIETPASALGKYLAEQTQKYIEQTGLAPEDAQRAVTIIADLLSGLAADDEARRGLHGLLGHLEQNFNLAEALQEASESEVIQTPKIITPGQLPPARAS